MDAFTITIHMRYPEDNEWSQISKHFMTREGIRKYFISVFEKNVKNAYDTELEYHLKNKAWNHDGPMYKITSMNLERAKSFRKVQDEFLNDVTYLGIGEIYNLNINYYISMNPLKIYQ